MKWLLLEKGFQKCLKKDVGFLCRTKKKALYFFFSALFFLCHSKFCNGNGMITQKSQGIKYFYAHILSK